MIIYSILILIFLILAPYIIYPAVMLTLSYLLPRNRKDYQELTPHVTIIIPTYNEEKVITDRFSNLESLSYPRNKLQVIIVDSGSKDRTFEIAERLAKTSDLDYLVLKQNERKGKANAVNLAIQYSKGEIIIVSDANALFESSSILKIVQPFYDYRVGGVGGKFITLGTSTAGKGEELYWSIEDKIRTTESLLYSITNFSGEFNSFKKSLGIILDEKSLAEDLDLTLQIIEKGYKVVYVPNALVYEPAVENFNDLIKQKKRRAVGTIQVIFKHISIFMNPNLIIFNFLFFFHKILRVFTPINTVILFILLSLFFITGDYSYKYEALGLAVALVIIPIAIFEVVFKKSLLRKLYYFLGVQYSYILAWIEFLTGKYKVTWEKTESSRDLKNVMNKIK